VDLDVPDGPVPLQLSGLIWCVRSKSYGQGRSERGKAHLGFTVDRRRDRGQVGDSGEVLATSEWWRYHDGLREVKESSSAWSARSIAS
jgi:hypothetical protein